MIDKLAPFSRRRRISRYAHKVQVQSIIGMIQKTFKWLSIARTWKPDRISKISLEGVEQLESCQQLLYVHPKKNPFSDEKPKFAQNFLFNPTPAWRRENSNFYFCLPRAHHNSSCKWLARNLDRFFCVLESTFVDSHGLWVKKSRENEPLECEHMCALWNPRSWAAFYDKLLKREQLCFLLLSPKMSLTCRRLWRQVQTSTGELGVALHWSLDFGTSNDSPKQPVSSPVFISLRHQSELRN